MDIKNVNPEELKKTVEISLKVLETAGDPVVVSEAKKIEGVVDQLLAIKDEKKPAVLEHIENAKAFDQSLVSKYGLVTARIIEFAIVALIGVKYLYLG
jgi:hypothetical protein